MARRYHEIKGLAEFTAKTIVSDQLSEVGAPSKRPSMGVDD